MDYIDRKRRVSAERRDPVGEQHQWDDGGDVVMAAAPKKYGSRLRLAACLSRHIPWRRQRHRNGAVG